MAKTAEDLRATFWSIMARANLSGFLSWESDPDRGDRVCMANAPRGWAQVARFCASTGAGGTWIPSDSGVSWRFGSLRGGTITDAGGNWERDVLGGYVRGEWRMGAREILAGLVGKEEAADVWTVGGAARKLWNWIGAGEKHEYPTLPDRAQTENLYPIVGTQTVHLPNGRTEDVSVREQIAYHDCYPGEYEGITMWDVDSYYATMLQRVAEGKRLSLRPIYHEEKNRIRWGRWREGERERLIDALGAAWPHKRLRNSLWGVALGSYRYQIAYVAAGEGKARRIMFRPGPGPFRPLALVIARSARDLCHAQALTVNSRYSTVDSVSVANGCLPRLWQAYGFTVNVKHKGNADFRSYGTWAFWREGSPKPPDPAAPAPEWLHRTEPYKRGRALTRPAGRPDNPGSLYALWL